MKAIHVPNIDARYWAAITMASVFGTNTGDVFAFESGLGILGGIPILAAILAVAYLLERRDNTRHEAWYWLAIILIRTGATNIADFVCGGRFLGVNRFAFSVALAVVIGVMAFMHHRKRGEPGIPQTNANYWITMLAAGVFGTAAGDAITGALGGPHAMGGVYASLALAATLAVVLWSGRGGRIQTLFYYWLAICVARTAGTAIADMLAENETLDIGLPVATLVTGTVFVLVLILWKSQPRRDPVPAWPGYGF
jgi:uncharacterized membrane-anchored protein